MEGIRALLLLSRKLLCSKIDLDILHNKASFLWRQSSKGVSRLAQFFLYFILLFLYKRGNKFKQSTLEQKSILCVLNHFKKLSKQYTTSAQCNLRILYTQGLSD